MYNSLKKLSIKQKIIFIPVLSGIMFSIISLTILILNQNSEEHALKIQNLYYPLISLNFKVEQKFTFIQRELQDAVAEADPEMIDDITVVYKALIDTLQSNGHRFAEEGDSLLALREKCTIYYKVATNVSHALIREGVTESNIEDIEYMTFLYNDLREALSKASRRHNMAIEDGFQITLNNYSNLLYSSLFLTILCIGLITLISLITTKSITHPLDKLVELANRFSKGDFSADVNITSYGEIGVLKNAFEKMAHEIKLLISEKDKALSTLTLSKEFIEQNAKQLEELNVDLKSEIDERRKAEEELHLHRSQLEEMIEERTSELSLANTELLQEIDVRKKIEARQLLLNKSLESANQELKSFAYVVSHDLKAPLRAIGSLTDWLSNDYMDKLDEEGQNLLTLLVTRVKRMHRLIEGILEYSRLGRIREEKRHVNLNEVVSTALDIIAPPPEIQINIQKNLPTLVCEKTRIIQVFQNLIGNAIKYMDKPNGIVHVKYTSSESNWLFSIADNGCGIDKKHFHKIFQIFQTLKARDEYESTGIGLPLVKRIIEMYGGEIWLESEPGQGTTFYFTLPKKINKSEEATETIINTVPEEQETELSG